MARRSYNRRTNYRSNKSYEQARKHIEEAKALSEELGGNDKDVKDFFFNLRGDQLGAVLEAYEDSFGLKAREYAEIALPQWKSGSKKMSGLVASRLFSLLPGFMSTQDKLCLAESLWRHVGPRSTRYLYIGKAASDHEIQQVVAKELDSLASNWRIPEEMEKRFAWLSEGDVAVEQQLLSHITGLEKAQSGISAADLVTDFMRRYEAERSGSLALFRHTISVGNQKLQIEFSEDDVTERRDTPKPVNQSNQYTRDDTKQDWSGVVIFVVIAIVVILAIAG